MLLLMAIRDWPVDERPTEKLLDKGASALSDAELLAILLHIGPSLASPRATCDFLVAKLRDLEHEMFCCLYLD
jgi:DNA repair protein RadC